MITTWLIYFLATAVASVFFLCAGWQSKRIQGLSSLRNGHEWPWGAFRREAEIDEPELQADAGAALRLALKRLAPLMANLSVQVEIAAAFGLMVQMRRAALVELLEEMLTVVIHAAPLSRILLTAAADGPHIVISMSDDIPNANQDVRKASVRGLMRRVAMRGGGLEVTVYPGDGTTMTLRLSCGDKEDLTSLEPTEETLSLSPSVRA